MVSSRWLGPALVLLTAVASGFAYADLPANVMLPWRSAEAPVSRDYAVAFIPAVIFGIWLLLQIFPAIDPRRANYAGFRRTYWLLGNTLLVFLAAAHGLLLAGVAEPDRWLVAGAGLIAVVTGNFLGRVEPNWFVGLRTPWTLESDVVWHRTHRLVGRLLFLAGLLLITLAPVLHMPPPAALGGLAALLAVGSFLLSYVIWRKLEKAGNSG